MSSTVKSPSVFNNTKATSFSKKEGMFQSKGLSSPVNLKTAGPSYGIS